MPWDSDGNFVYPSSGPKRRVSVNLSEVGRHILDKMASQWEMSKTDVVETLLRESRYQNLRDRASYSPSPSHSPSPSAAVDAESDD